MDTKSVLEEIKKRLEEKKKDSFTSHNEEELHGLCYASEIVDDVARESGIELDFESSFG